jgi:NADPH-dependent glutamate synthase beta subunit-like oxidoreductase/Pyruvate/2-oxoacid:ferredoxin oxidoreductase delta subunit
MSSKPREDATDRPAPLGEDRFRLSLRVPAQLEKAPPCQAGCPNGNDVRGWIGLIAQHEKTGMSRDEAYAAAWQRLVENNPFPATLGRVCPHPCETQCTRAESEGAVAINALERFIGDWAIARGLPLQQAEFETPPESIGVVGAGPAGLSFAYQMARRGYRVTVYERSSKPGGMLMHGIPEYRLPEEIVAAEVQRIFDLGVELQLDTGVGRDVSLADLRARHAVLFLGIGAQSAKGLGIPGEAGSGVWRGTEFLDALNAGERIEVGRRVVVVGGGNSAVDAARSARRLGAEVTLLYRRTRQEMPAGSDEVDEAIEEGVHLVLLSAPLEIERDDGRVRAVTVQQMALGARDASGRRAPVPVSGATSTLEADTVIAAVSQVPDWTGLDDVRPDGGWLEPADAGEIAGAVWAGGDARGLGIVGLAISHGRQAAEAVHAKLRGLPADPEVPARPAIDPGAVRTEYYPEKPPVTRPRRPSQECLGDLDVEVAQTLDESAFLEEASRCFSCGLCFGCQQCWMYCNPGGFTRVDQVQPGVYFAQGLDRCEGCGKCLEVCPCGFLSETTS